MSGSTFMDSIKEMDYIQVKEDLRDRIAAFYGVSKIFMADNSASGGLNNEGMQILVTNRAVEMAQTIWNNYVFPFMTEEFGIWIGSWYCHPQRKRMRLPN